MTNLKHSGLFWSPEPKAIKQKSEAPFPHWLEPGYMPGYELTEIDLMTDDEILTGTGQLICDIEIYPNYFLVAFMSMESGKCITIEDDMEKLNWILHKYQIITFNGNHFDCPIMALAIAGKSLEELKYATDMLIGQGMKGWEVLKSFKVEPLEIDHIDLIEVCPLSASLKIYGGRLHVPRMQDLPFHPDSELTDAQKAIVRHYCINDLVTTAFVNSNLVDQLAIREEMSNKYGIDLRSKSDAQVAEAVIKVELTRMGKKPERPRLETGRSYRYKFPKFLKFQSDEIERAVTLIRKALFVVREKGGIEMPPELNGLEIKIGKGVYRMGIGGLHSSETNVSYQSDDTFCLEDHDVISFYPSIIINQGLYPEHLGPNFLNVYISIVSRRVKAKRNGIKTEADMFKLVSNGSFGKFGSKWSCLYAPDLLIQVTISGQLSLLMLIEKLENEGIQIVSANTDGIVMRYPKVMKSVVSDAIKDWEKITGYTTEKTEYKGIYSKDVNNYLAIKQDGEIKGKGAYSIGEGIFRFHKNPTNSICIEAVVDYLTKGVPISETVRTEKDFTKFITVRAVKGGAVKNGQYLGKAIRWYLSTTSAGDIIYAKNGNKVPKSSGAQPIMELPEEFPNDVDYARYEIECFEILKDIAAI